MLELTSPAFIRQLAARHGERELIVLDDQRIGYAEADARSAVLARGMLSQGIGKGTRVALLMPNGPDFVLSWLAATRIGALVVPLSTFYKPKELLYVLRHADVSVLLTVPNLLSNDYLARLEECAPSLRGADRSALFLPELPYLRRVYVLGGSDRPWACSYGELQECAVDDAFLRAVESHVTPADPITIIYSSGSAADPKGAVHTHAALLRHSYNLANLRDIEPEDRCFSPMPFFWVGGLVFTLYCVMHKGACLITESVFDPEQTLKLLERERVSHVSGWPHYGKAMVDHPTFKDRDLRALRAGNIYAILPDWARPRDAELRSNGLGMTETCGPHSIARMDRDLPEHLRGTFGHAVGEVERKIIDPATGKQLPNGQVGELCVRGYSVMRELYKVLREDTFDADGYYHTGDACSLNDEGYLFFKGRLGDLIKTAGSNVVPREIELAIEAQPEVRAAYVCGLPDPDRGENVAAVVVLKEGQALDVATLKRRLKDELSSYKVPREFFFFAPAEIPMTSSGKLDKRALIARLQTYA